jgi:hypothetical protein
VTALVGADRDAIGVFLDRRAHDVIHTPIVPEMDNLGALRLNQASHDVDCGIVTIKQGCGGHKAQWRGLAFSGYAR